MDQPELGRKIAELRKARGMTQEELVEKCNLNVRTLQRIESGDVYPRSYTLKLIYSALDFDEKSNSKWLEQFYIYFIDLFNLKTHTMKKVTILTVLLTGIILVIFNVTNHIYAQRDSNLKEESWQHEDSGKEEDSAVKYSSFQSEESFYDNDNLIGRNTVLTSNGVTISSSLILINEATHEFITSYATGRLAKNKVEIFCSKEFLDSIKYSSLEERVSPGKFHLIGYAKIILGENKYIEAPEIILITN